MSHLISPALDDVWGRAAIVITGVSRGLGRALTEEFIGLGYTVVGCARSRDEIAALAAAHPAHDFQAVDVRIDSGVGHWAQRVSRKFGVPGLVINSAGILNCGGPLWQVRDAEFSAAVDTNVKGPANVVRHFVPLMVARGSGVIVNFTSRWGRDIHVNMGPYCLTKSALVTFTRVLAEELKPTGVTAVAVNPGIVQTAMLGQYLSLEPHSCDPAPLDPAEWAKIAAPFLLSLGLPDTGAVIDLSPATGYVPHRDGQNINML